MILWELNLYEISVLEGDALKTWIASRAVLAREVEYESMLAVEKQRMSLNSGHVTDGIFRARTLVANWPRALYSSPL